MLAGRTNIKVGTHVRIKGVAGEDHFLNGLTGIVTHPFAFGCTDKAWVGIRLDEDCSNTSYGEKINLHKKNIEEL